jgi:stage III sporulation protein AG
LVSKEKEEDGNNKKKIENLVVLIIILIITVIVINVIWNGDKEDSEEQKNTVSNKKLASENEQIEEVSSSTYELSEELENILSKIDGVGDVNVMITYSQTSQTIPLYNEDTSVKNTEESDTSGGTRKVTETDTKKDVIYKESNGEKEPITQSIISPKIEGAIVTAKGANDANIKAKIIQAVEAVTGLSTHKIQVFEMKS